MKNSYFYLSNSTTSPIHVQCTNFQVGQDSRHGGKIVVQALAMCHWCKCVSLRQGSNWGMKMSLRKRSVAKARKYCRGCCWCSGCCKSFKHSQQHCTLGRAMAPCGTMHWPSLHPSFDKNPKTEIIKKKRSLKLKQQIVIHLWIFPIKTKMFTHRTKLCTNLSKYSFKK